MSTSEPDRDQAQPMPPDATTETSPLELPRSRRARIGLPRLLLGILLSVALAGLLMLGWVLGTQSGLRLAIAVVEELAPDRVRVERADGRLIGRFGLTGVEVSLPDGFSTRVGRLVLDWTPLGLLGGTLPIAQLLASDLDITLPPSDEEPKEPLVLPDIALPLRIELGQARVERLRLFNLGANAPFVTLEHADLAARLSGSELVVEQLEAALAAPDLQAKARGQAVLVDRYPLALDLDWTFDQAPDLALQGAARITGDLSALAIQHRLTGSAAADLEVTLRDPLGALSWEGRLDLLGVELPDLDPELPQVAIEALLETQGTLERASLSGQIDARAPDLPDFGHLAAVLDIGWAEQVLMIHALELTEQVSEARLAATGRLDLGTEGGQVELNGRWERLRWPLSGELLAESPQGTLDVSGTLDDFVYRSTLSARGPDVPPLEARLDGRAGLTATQIERLEVETLDGVLTLTGEVAWSPELSWTLDLDGKDLDPARLVAGLEDRLTLGLRTSGGLQGFDYGLEATTVGPGLPPSRLRLEGQGDQRQTRLESLVLETLDGRIEGRAEVAWAPQVSWTAELDVTGLNPGVQAPQWPGSIAARLTSRGTLESAGPNLSAVIERLDGELRGYPIAASGQVTMLGESIQIQDLSAASGPTRLSLRGRVEDQLDLAFDLASSDLASLLPEARGSLSASGTIAGPRQAPRLRMDLAARDAEWSGQGIGSLAGTLDLGLAPADPFEIQLDGSGLVVGDLRWDSLAVRGEGRIPDHRLELALVGEPFGLRLEGSGGLSDGGAYAGRLARLDLSHSTFGDWSLQRPSPFSLHGARIGAGPLCVRGPSAAGGCVELAQSAANRWTANLDLALPDLALLAPLMPESLTLAGDARLAGRFEANGAVLSGNATAELPRGSVSLRLGGGRDERIDFSGTRLTLESSARALVARLGVPLEGLGRIDGNLTLAGWRLDDPARPAQPLSGALTADLKGLDRIAELVPDLTGVTGGIDVDLGLAGTLGAPGVRGEARLAGVGFQVPLIGLRVANLDLTASAPTLDRLDLSGQGDVGGGHLDLSGEVLLGGGGFASRLKVAGKRLKVADTREYFAMVSPNLDIEANSKGARVNGEILIPEARIRPRSIPAGTQTPSSDVVIEDRGEAAPFPVEIDLRLRLGDEVTIDAFGVRGRLAGDLALRQAPGREMLGDGQLQIVDGQYRMSGGFGLAADLGTPLNITQGRLVFARSPIDNPGLLLQAEREGGSTSAGVRVLGTLRDPKLAFFSESDPGMTQAEITKFLLTGIAPRRDEGGVNPGLAVGTYIAPKIFLEYESGLGDQANKVRLRYDLTNRIELQTETGGGSQGADIFFTFER